MSTQTPHYQDDGTTQRYGGQGGGEGRGMWSTAPTTGRAKSKPFFMTSEFLVLLATILSVVIAAAIAENFGAPQAWTLVTILSAAYIVSRGLSKIGHHHGDRG